jgi:hypothetical protein
MTYGPITIIDIDHGEDGPAVGQPTVTVTYRPITIIDINHDEGAPAVGQPAVTVDTLLTIESILGLTPDQVAHVRKNAPTIRANADKWVQEVLDAQARTAKPAAATRRPPPRPKPFDDTALLDQMHASRQADPALSVWKAAEAVAHLADGKPGSSLESRRNRLIKGFKRRFQSVKGLTGS